MCKERHVRCKQPTRDFFFQSCHIIFLVRPGANFLWHDDGTSDQKIVLKLFDRAFESAE